MTFPGRPLRRRTRPHRQPSLHDWTRAYGFVLLGRDLDARRPEAGLVDYGDSPVWIYDNAIGGCRLASLRQERGEGA